MTQYPDLFAALAAPFEPNEVKVFTTPNGRQLHYITARTAMNRLDSVLGPENWWDEFVPMENAVLCKLTIRLPDGSTVTKADAGGYAGMETRRNGEIVKDDENNEKSAFSDSFKRACAKFGVGRYLYRDGVPAFVREREPAVESAAPAQPSQAQGPGRDEPLPPAPAAPPSRVGNAPPRSGKALFAWTKDQEQRHEVGLLKYLNHWGKLQDYPSRMIEWDADQVAAAYAEACRKLQAIQPGRAEAYEEALAN
jgi:hypothetical protein